MKLLVAAFLCLTFVTVYGEILQELKDKLHVAGNKCQEDPKTAIDRDAMKKYLDSKKQEPVPANLDAHNLCITKELKWQKADGTVDKELLKERIQHHETDPAKVQQTLDDCAVDKATPEETAHHLLKCLIKHSEKK